MPEGPDESQTKKTTYLRHFWVQEPRHSENISDEKCYLYRSTPQHGGEFKVPVGALLKVFFFTLNHLSIGKFLA